MWQYCTECKVTLKEQHPWTYDTPRDYDFFLMDEILQSDISDEHKEIFNQVRLSMKLLTASDIVIANHGSRIHPDIMKGINHRWSVLEWPKILPFPKKWTKVFNNLLMTLIAPRLQSSPLGYWKSPGHQRWQYFARGETVVWKQQRPSYIQYGPETIINCVPVDILANDSQIFGTQTILHQDHEQPRIINPFDRITSSPAWMKRIWGQHQLTPETINKIIKAIENGSLIGGGDGSVKHGRGSHAWEFAHKNDFSTICNGTGPVDGPNDTMCSFRAEATHLLAMVTLINRLAPFIKKKKSPITLLTDSESVLQAIKDYKLNSLKNILQDHHDIILQLKTSIKKSEFKFDFEYVKAHQKETDSITQEAEMNNRVNDLAYN